MIIDHPLILELHGCRRQIRKHYAFVWVSGDRAPDFSQNSRNRKQILEQSDECTWVGSGKQKTTASTGWGTISSASASRLYTSWNSATSSGTPSDHMSCAPRASASPARRGRGARSERQWTEAMAKGGEAEPGWIRRGSTRAAAISRRGRPEPAARRRRAPLPWGIRRGNLAAVGLETSGQYSSSRAGLPPSCMGRTFYVGYMGPTKLSRIVIPVHVRPKKNPAYVRPNCAPTRRHHAALRCRNDASSLPPISRIQSNDTVGLRCGDARRRLCRRRRRTKTARKPPSMHLAGASAGAWARLERRWRRLDEGVAVALTCTGAEYELCSSRKYWFYSFKKWFSNCPQAYVKFTATHFN